MTVLVFLGYSEAFDIINYVSLSHNSVNFLHSYPKEIMQQVADGGHLSRFHPTASSVP